MHTGSEGNITSALNKMKEEHIKNSNWNTKVTDLWDKLSFDESLVYSPVSTCGEYPEPKGPCPQMEAVIATAHYTVKS